MPNEIGPVKDKPKDKLTKEEREEKAALAAQFGWSMAFINSIPELKKIFDRAVKKDYTRERFRTEVQNSKWYRSHSDTWREMAYLKATQPKTYKEKYRQSLAMVQDIAAQMGASNMNGAFGRIARSALWLGWSENQIRNNLAKAIDVAGKTGSYKGEAGIAEQELRQYAYQMGVQFSDANLKNWVRNIAAGNSTTADYKAYLQQMAETAFPTLARQIRSGLTVAQIADPYIQSMSRLLELNPAQVDLFNPQVRRALTGVSPDGKGPTLKPLYQFEDEIRRSPEWLKTDNARQQIMSVGHQILSDFGFAY